MKNKACRILCALLILGLCVFSCCAEESTGGLLLLVNPEHPLQEGFVPAGLVPLESVIPEGLCTYEHEGILGCREAALAWVRLLTAAREDGLTAWCFSEGYRTFEDQEKLWQDSVESFMTAYGLSRERAEEAAALTVALPGESEHHTGLAFDVTVPGEYFGDTPQYRWMRQHCWEYGFILRYTEEKYDETGYEEEEWHYRYVGVENALYMFENDLCLEEYLAE